MGHEKRRKASRCGTGFRAEVWCNFDVCGIICACITWFLIAYAEYVTVVCIYFFFFFSYNVQDVIVYNEFSYCAIRGLLSILGWALVYWDYAIYVLLVLSLF